MKHAYKTLDALRGVAALAVVVFHAKRLLGWSAIPSGYLAVDFFFLLSGFVIAHAYDTRLTTQLSATHFIWQRFIRFYPLYFAGFVAGLLYELGLVATHNPGAISLPTILAAACAAFVFMPFPFAQRDGNIFAFNIPSWSLFYELAVNALYAIFFRHLKAPVLATIMVASGSVFAFAIILEGTGDFGALAADSLVAIPRTMFSFSAGLLLYRSKVTGPKVPKILIFGMLVIPMLIPINAAGNIVFVFAISPLIVMFASATEPGPKSVKTFEYLGLISFPIYAIHRPVLAFVQTFADRLSLPPLVALCVAVIFLVLLGPAVERYYDRPVRKLLSGRTRGAIKKQTPSAGEVTPAHLDSNTLPRSSPELRTEAPLRIPKGL